jgi:hypothetical protein
MLLLWDLGFFDGNGHRLFGRMENESGCGDGHGNRDDLWFWMSQSLRVPDILLVVVMVIVPVDSHPAVEHGHGTRHPVEVWHCGCRICRRGLCLAPAGLCYLCLLSRRGHNQEIVSDELSRLRLKTQQLSCSFVVSISQDLGDVS